MKNRVKNNSKEKHVIDCFFLSNAFMQLVTCAGP